MHDPLNAFRTHVTLDGSGKGPLVGLTIAGHRSDSGHPLWLKTHSPAA
jgi:hypothetical protein